MTTIAIIPARGGSGGLARKNVLPLAGKPLIAHTIEHSKKSLLVNRTFVSTEDEEIASISYNHGAEVVMRPLELASDTASSESALVHTINYLRDKEGCNPDLIVFLQCTSPIRLPNDVDNAIKRLLSQEADSLFSACRSHAFIWRRINSEIEPVNYDYRERKRRQEMADEFIENGSIYVFRPWVLEKLHNRLGGKVTFYEMAYWSLFQVDS
ncbi:acylneuraminate cytidylyltransferase family protein, partial [bacterium]